MKKIILFFKENLEESILALMLFILCSIYIHSVFQQIQENKLVEKEQQILLNEMIRHYQEINVLEEQPNLNK